MVCNKPGGFDDGDFVVEFFGEVCFIVFATSMLFPCKNYIVVLIVFSRMTRRLCEWLMGGWFLFACKFRITSIYMSSQTFLCY